ncbi:MAG: radical SAM protein [Candidatus Hydrothermae bacterium]|nr:radical SAM protein [Candidatus Hydrothermae bacterium]
MAVNPQGGSSMTSSSHPGHATRLRPVLAGPAPFEGYLFQDAPQNIYWEVTRACDLVCRHCRADAQVDRHPHELTHEEGRRLLDDIAGMGSLLIFTGGDPLKRPDLFDLMAYARERRIPFGITPSTTPLLTREVLARFKSLGVMALGLSLDAPTAEVHDAFRGWSGAFDRALEVLHWAGEVGIPVQINTTVTARNIHLIPDMLEVLRPFSPPIRRWSLFVLIPVGRGVTLGLPQGDDLDRLFSWADATRRKRLRSIGAGIRDGNGVIFVSHTGDVYPSGFLPLRAGNVREAPLSEIYRTSPLLQTLRNPDLLEGRCGRCLYRYLCGGSRARAWGLSGNMMGEEPLCTVFQPDPARIKTG